VWGRCCTLPPAASGAASAGAWYLPNAPAFRSFPPEHPRYAGGQPYAFIDSHVKMMSFDPTYVSPANNICIIRRAHGAHPPPVVVWRPR
jgi:hypothetical protein